MSLLEQEQHHYYPPQSLAEEMPDYTAEATDPLTTAVDAAHAEAQGAIQPHEKILGQAAVKANIELQHAVVTGSENTAQLEQSVKDKLEAVREDIRTAHRSERKEFGKALFADGVPPMLVDGVGARQPRKFAAKLAEKDSAGNYVVSDGALLNILEWHNMNVERKRQVLEKEVLTPLRERYIERMDQAVRDGWIEPDMFDESRRELVRSVPIYFDDGIGPDDQFRFNRLGTSRAYAQPSEHPYMALSLHKINRRRFERTFMHEMTHIMTGETQAMQNNWQRVGARKYGLNRLSIPDARNQAPEKPFMSFGAGWGSRAESSSDSKDLYSDSRGLSLLNEATTEHLADALVTGNFDKVSRGLPGRRSYKAGLRLLQTLTTKGRHPIAPGVFVRAMLAGTLTGSPDGDTSNVDHHLNSLRDELDSAFPHVDVVRMVTDMDSYGMNRSISRAELRAVGRQVVRSDQTRHRHAA